MAILDLLDVELRAGKKTLPEYDGIDQQENPPPRMTTKYVRVPASRIFQIRASVSENYQFNFEGLEFQILIDGRIYETLLTLKEQHPGGSADLAGVEVQGSDGVANITVRVYGITNCKETDSDGAYEDYDVDPIKAHKDELPNGVTQSVVLGRPRNFYSNDYINEDTPIATFELKYRTKEALNLILHPPDNLENPTGPSRAAFQTLIPITRTTRARSSILVPSRGSLEAQIEAVPRKPNISHPPRHRLLTTIVLNNPPTPQSSPTSSPHAPQHPQIHPNPSLNAIKQQADTSLTPAPNAHLHPSSHRACPHEGKETSARAGDISEDEDSGDGMKKGRKWV
ncbi:MAG: hypothetical protein Q9199_001216 [Rusavskia elegans]